MRNEVTILIAEDDSGHAALIERNLRRAGIENEILRFSDGAEILEFLAAHSPAEDSAEDGRAFVTLLDIRMPRVDGIHVLRTVKQDPEFRKMPVIMMTTTDDPNDVEACHALGCNHYVTKPIDYDDFVEVVRSLGRWLTVISVPSVRNVLGNAS